MPRQTVNEKKYLAARMAQKRLEHRFDMIEYAETLRQDLERMKDELGRMPEITIGRFDEDSDR